MAKLEAHDEDPLAVRSCAVMFLPITTWNCQWRELERAVVALVVFAIYSPS